MWACVKLKEHPGAEEEFSRVVVPSNWRKDGKVFWSNTLNAEKNFKNRTPIDKKWPCYDELKLYLLSDDLKLCEDFRDGVATTEEEDTQKQINKVDERSPDKSLPSPIEEVPKKGKRKKRTLSSSSEDSDGADKSLQSPIEEVPKKGKVKKRTHSSSSEDSDFADISSKEKSQTRDSSSFGAFSGRSNKTPRKSLNFSTTSPRRSPRIGQKKEELFGTEFFRSPKGGFQRTKTTNKIDTPMQTKPLSPRSGSTSSLSSSQSKQTPSKRQANAPIGSNSGHSSKRKSKDNSKPGSTGKSNKYRYPLETADFQQRVIQLLLQIRNSLQADENAELIELPKCSTVEELEEYEELLNDKAEYAKLKKSLSLIGGSNVRAVINQMLHSFTDNSVLSHINWDGNGDKISFENKLKNIHKAINGVIFRKFKLPGTDTNQTKRAIQGILRDAPDGPGGTRFERKKAEKERERKK